MHEVSYQAIREYLAAHMPTMSEYMEDLLMPLKKGAKPGSKGFGENIAAELKAGKPRSQSIAIAYSEAKAKPKKKKK